MKKQPEPVTAGCRRRSKNSGVNPVKVVTATPYIIRVAATTGGDNRPALTGQGKKKTVKGLDLLSLDDIVRAAQKSERRMNKIFRHNRRRNILTICAAYRYEIDLARIARPEKLLGWVDHLCGKPWMDRELVAEFVSRVSAIKGWAIHPI